MITIKYKDIQHLIPEDCIYDGFDNEIVIYHQGDYVTENPIDLDFGDKLDPDYSCKELPAFILINGNLNAKNICNGETDGSIDNSFSYPFAETFGSEKTLQNPV